MNRSQKIKIRSIFSGIEHRYLLLTGKEFIHFLHIGKTGGSAIKYALQPYERNGKYVMRLHSHSVKLWDVPEGEKVFFFLRDPLSRFISGFYSRQRQGRPHGFFAWTKDEEIAFRNFSTPNQLGCGLTSSDPDEKQKAYHAMKSIRHVNTHYWDWFKDREYFLSRSKDILMVGFQESLSADFEQLKQKLDLPEKLQLPVDDAIKHKRVGPDTDISPEAINNLRNWYQTDYEFLNFIHDFLSSKMIDA